MNEETKNIEQPELADADLYIVAVGRPIKTCPPIGTEQHPQI